MYKPRPRRRTSAFGLALVLIISVFAAVSQPASAARQSKTTICHATHSATNPFEQITVSNAALKAHAKHAGDVIPAPAGGCGPQAPVDVCPNLVGDQTSVPVGMILDGAGNCVPAPQPCSAATASGGEGTTVTLHELGQHGPLTFQFTYEAYSVPDEFIVKYEGNVVYTTGGAVSGGQSVAVVLPSGSSTQVEVTVVGPSGTAWDYTVSCPAPPV